MNQLLDEAKELMITKGYTEDEISMVVDSLSNFFQYISRNTLGVEFFDRISSFKSNMIRRINEQRSAANIASIAEFNGTSPASVFVKECIEKRVQKVLNGFLESSINYYNMACNNEGVDFTRLKLLLGKDGIDSEKSVDLTSPATIVSFSTELSLKTLYSMKNYDAIVRNAYSKVTSNVGDRDESLFHDKVKMIELVSGDWKNISISDTAINVMNDVRDSYVGDKPINLPENDRQGNVKVNGHTLYKVFDNLPEEYKAMIKYQIATSFSRGDSTDIDEKLISAIDYFLMISELDTTVVNLDSTKQMVVNSNNFDRMRYLIDRLGSEDLLFSIAYARASYIVAKNEVDGVCFSSIKNSNYSNKGLQYTNELDVLIKANGDKKETLDYIIGNKKIFAVVKQLNAKDLYVLIDMFNKDEIDWMMESCNVEESCSFKEMFYYSIFFKKHVNNYEFLYDNDKYRNINRLFYTIKNTNNLAMLGNQIAQWFAEIDVYLLSDEEFEALKIFDVDYIYNSLSFKDRVLYKKCVDKGIDFKLHYLSNVISSTIAEDMSTPEFSADDFESRIKNRVNRRYNTVLVINDEKFSKIKQNSVIFELLCKEFGSFENIPKFLLNVNVEYLRILFDYCEKNNVSLSQLVYQNMSEPCFYCRAIYALRNIRMNTDTMTIKISGPAIDSFISRGDTARFMREYNEQEVNLFGSGAPIERLKYSSNLCNALLCDDMVEWNIEIEKQPNEEFIDYLLDKGINYTEAFAVSTHSTKEEVDLLFNKLEGYGIPFRVITSVVNKVVPLERVLERNQLFREYGCKLENIPDYYYLRNGKTIDDFKTLFSVLDGIYQKENIPTIFFDPSAEDIQELIDKLSKEDINIYRFISLMPANSQLLFKNIDKYIYVYKQIKDVPVNSGMEIRSFDSVVAIYNKLKSVLGYDKDDSLLLKCSLYKSFEDINMILAMCNEKDIPFLPEYLYFDTGFLTVNLDYVHMLISGMKDMNIEINYENALALMEKSGFVFNDMHASVHKSVRVA